MGIPLHFVHLTFRRTVPFLPALLFLVVVISLASRATAVDTARNQGTSMQKRLAIMQAEYEAALFEAYSKYSPYFEKAYKTYPVIPIGVLEAISYAETDFYYQIPDEESIYPSYGLMGLRLNSKGVFNDNLILVSDLSGYTVDEIKYDPEIHMMAFAAAYVTLRNQFQINSNKIEAQLPILEALNDIPAGSENDRFPIDVYLHSVLSFLNNEKWQSLFNFPYYSINLVDVFGENDYKVLSSNYLSSGNTNIQNSYGISSLSEHPDCAQCVYPAGIDYVTQGATCFLDHPTPRSKDQITHVVIHSTDADLNYQDQLNAWKNCGDPGSNFAAHYLVSKEGQIARPFHELLAVSHAGAVNAYTIGIEHVGWAAQNAWPPAIYQASAALVRGITCCFGINRASMYFGSGTGPEFPYILPNCINIKGHGQFSPNPKGKWDPGAYWNWFDHYRLVNGGAEPPFTRPAETRTRCSGYLEDLGGPQGDYSPNQRYVVTIKPEGAAKVKLKFSKFNTAAGDWLVLWDGPVPDASPLIGAWSLNGLPNGGQIISTGNSITLEFRSDCGNEAQGWELSWEGSNPDGSSACCPAPVTRDANGITSTGATLRWQAVPGVLQYGVQIKRVSDPFWPPPFNFTLVPGDTTSLLVSGLAQNTNYMFRVLTVCAGNENSSLYSQPRQFKTCSSAEVCVHCLTPENLDAKEVTVSSAKLTWDPGQGAGAYEVQYRKASEANWHSPDPVENDKLTIENLTSGTEYLFHVRSVCSSVSSDYSAERSFRTLNCTLPARFRATNIDYQSARMKWDDVPGARSYHLQYKQTSSSAWIGPLAPDENSFLLPNLMPKTEYEVQIKTTCSTSPGDESGFSESVRFTTTCRVPESITVTTTSNSATIDWASTDAGVYAFRYRKTTSSQPWTEIPDITKSNYTINGLTGGDYEFQVRSKCSSTDLSEWSVKSRFSLACASLTNLGAQSGRDSVTLTWNGIGETFEVRYKSNTTDWKTVRASRSPFKVRNLQEGTTYDFQARAICALNANGQDVLHSNWTGLTVTTGGGGSCSNPMVLHCPSQKHINIKRKGSNKLRIWWGSFNRLTGWRLEIRPVNGGSTSVYDDWDYDEFIDCKPGGVPDHIDYTKIVRGLRSGTTYDIEVSIKCSDGKYSAPISRRYTTSNSSSIIPTALPPTQVGATSATLQWRPVAGATGYSVTYSLAKSDDETGTVVNVSASTTSLQLLGLTTGAAYEYEVQALFQSSTSDLSETLSFVPSPSNACGYGVSPPNHAAIASEGGIGSVSVTAGTGCGWTSVSNAAWISITSGATGSGSGTVSYSISTNSGSDARTGSLTIAGQTVQINQLGVNPNNLTPVITEISPSRVVAGRGAFTLEVKGNNFLSDCYVVVDGFVQETTFVSSSLLTVSVWEHAVASPGAKNIIVHNPPPGAKISNTVSLTVEPSTANLPPWVSAISPRMAQVGSYEFTLTVYGSSFVNGSVVRFNGVDRPTTFVSSGLLTAEISSEDVSIVGSPSITVFTPKPGGGVSNPATFYVQENPNHPAPVITTISPVGVIAGSASFTLVLDGSGFIGSSQVRINEIWRTTIYVTPTRLTASIRSADIESSGTLVVTVYNTEPGGGVSNEVALSVNTLLSTSLNTTDLTDRAEKLPDRDDYHAGSIMAARLGISETERDAESQNPPSQPDRRKNRIVETIPYDALVLWVITAVLIFVRIRKPIPRAH